jgi:hypothetical protein
MKTGLYALSTGCLALFLNGCAGGPEQVPSYQAPSTFQSLPTYRYPQQQAANAAPPVQPSTAPQTAAPAAGTAAVTQAATAPQSEVIPPSPGPDYVWMPSYWTVGLGGGWVNVGGRYVLRQGVSEEQLRAARGMLEQARIGLAGKPLKNANRAIDEINEALQTR